MTHHHTRSDAPQPTSPRIPQPPRVARRLTCSESVECRARTLLTWHAGDCGLIDDFALGVIWRMICHGELSMCDVSLMTSCDVFFVIEDFVTGGKE